MEICPALPHKKKPRALPTSRVGVRAKLYAQVFPPERAALRAQRRKVGEMVFTDSKQAKGGPNPPLHRALLCGPRAAECVKHK